MTTGRFQLVLYLLAVLATISTWVVFIANGGYHDLVKATEAGYLPDGSRLRNTFIGLNPIDTHIRQAIFVNLPLVHTHSGNNDQGRRLMAHLVTDMTVILAILTIEIDSRRSTRGWGQQWRLFLWLLSTSLLTSAVVLPVFFLVHLDILLPSTLGEEPRPFSAVSTSRVWGSLLSILVGFVTPAILMFDPLNNGLHTQASSIALFAVGFPVWVVLAKSIFPLLLQVAGCMDHQYTAGGTSPQAQVYASLAIGSGIIHLFPGWRLSDIHYTSILHLMLGESETEPLLLDTKLFAFMEADYLFTASLVFAVVLCVLGHHTTISMPGRVALVCLAVAVIGPGSVMGVTWAFKEHCRYTMAIQQKRRPS